VSGILGRLRHGLRDMPAARAVAIRMHNFGRAPRHSDGVLFLNYHDMRARDRPRFAQQLRAMRQLADMVSVTDALSLLGSKRTGQYCISLTFDDSLLGAYEHALPILAEQGVPATFFLVPGWIDEQRADIFDWDACRKLVSAGMEVGSHSQNHHRLARMSGDEVLSDLIRSRTRIEHELARECVHFACPWGQPDADYQPARDPALARLAGFRSFLTTVPRHAGMGTSPFNLPRVRMEPGWGAAELRYAFLR
jgi:peptidoglycan/xylan/chitin deacetylase (PgdA/CDA1 family)